MKLDRAIAEALAELTIGQEIEVVYESAGSTSRETYRGAYAGQQKNAQGQSYFAVNAKGKGQRLMNPRRGKVHSIKAV